MYWQQLKGLLFLPSSDLCKQQNLQYLIFHQKCFGHAVQCPPSHYYTEVTAFLVLIVTVNLNIIITEKDVLGVKICSSQCLCSLKQLNVKPLFLRVEHQLVS